ncbi:MAG: hypothetical protein RSC96_04995 [Oscillospiraceae bacterium]
MLKIDELIISEECTALEAMHRLDETGLRIVFIAPDGVLKAVVTDADLRRFVKGRHAYRQCKRHGELFSAQLACVGAQPRKGVSA